MNAVTATTVTGTAQAVDGDQWTCHCSSSASTNDKGGRDSYVIHTNPDNGDRAGMNFTASSEKVLQWNDSKDNVDFYANLLEHEDSPNLALEHGGAREGQHL
ncbi:MULTISPECIES: hypothetical protein [unclassified Streptomyces]|uniref:hypothetical protein n=1 Tax=unclassified Streptomyces TaxID=2593676 RepID=UPI002475177F|nr:MULTISPECIES: hypothetical protein [unclassified Streptomyces]